VFLREWYVEAWTQAQHLGHGISLSPYIMPAAVSAILYYIAKQFSSAFYLLESLERRAGADCNDIFQMLFVSHNVFCHVEDLTKDTSFREFDFIFSVRCHWQAYSWWCASFQKFYVALQKKGQLFSSTHRSTMGGSDCISEATIQALSKNIAPRKRLCVWLYITENKWRGLPIVWRLL